MTVATAAAMGPRGEAAGATRHPAQAPTTAAECRDVHRVTGSTAAAMVQCSGGSYIERSALALQRSVVQAGRSGGGLYCCGRQRVTAAAIDGCI